MRRILRRAVLTLVPLGLFAAGCGGTADTRPATWSYISSAIVQPSCATANCHSKLAKRSGVVLDGMQDGWSQLVCRHFVVPSMAADSAMIALMNGTRVDAHASRFRAARRRHQVDRELDQRWRGLRRSRANTDVRTLMRLPSLAVGFFLLAVLLLAARPAAAYPQFQFSSGTQRCAQCHYAPAGFGLLTSWGRDEAADTISRGGDGGFLHGLWTPPSWLALGGDFRLAAIENDVGGAGSPEFAWFPMQSDLYVRGAFGDTGVSLYVAGGATGTTRPGTTSLVGHVQAVMSREHYLMWKPSATGPYVRVGRFYAPYGLRLVEHIYYVRRFTGFGLYEETYNVSGGYLDENWEVHATAFTPPPSSFPNQLQTSRNNMTGSGGALFAEKRFKSMAAVGLQSRVAINSEHRVIQAGAIGKIWVDGARMLFMGEVDAQRTDLSGSGGGYLGTVGYLGLTFFPIKGLMTGLAVEQYQEDIRVGTVARSAADLAINIFPWAHVELMILGRYQISGSGNADGVAASLGMLQLHYYL